MERWSEATWDPASSHVGGFVTGAPKGILHTTEGSTYAGAKGAYQANASWPHATLSYEGGRFAAWQHLDLNESAMALRHPAATCETNRATAIQVEIVGSADRGYAQRYGLLYVEDFPVDYLAGIARWMRYVERVAGVVSVVPFGFGPPGTVHRLNCNQWLPASGWLGHCHVPNNDHSDPGALAVESLLSTAPPQEDDDMAMIVLDPHGDDDQGRDSYWQADAAGNIGNWNAARSIRSLHDRGIALPPGHKIIGAVADPSGNGIVLVCDDQRQEPNGHWTSSTYRLMVGD